jgi:TRAP-type mannitol/chloroaromatic compound transport system permease large subunit
MPMPVRAKRQTVLELIGARGQLGAQRLQVTPRRSRRADPVLWGVLVFVNLQAAFLSPPVAMSAFYLKGVSPPHVTLNQIFSGMMPYMLIVIVCMVFMYLWPGMTLWLPTYLYGN